jgi:hypothetical protein
VPRVVAKVLFTAVRNGLAHFYDTKTIVLGRDEVIVALSWSQRSHLSVTREDWLHDGPPRVGICLNVGALCVDLEAYFAQLAGRLQRDADLARRIIENASKQTPPVPQGDALRIWREYLATQQMTPSRPAHHDEEN